MDLVVFLDHRFWKHPDGTIWTKTVHGYSYWQRYLEVFPRVRVVSRVIALAASDEGSGSLAERVDGPGVTVQSLGDYVGQLQVVLAARRSTALIDDVLRGRPAVIVRASSHTGYLASRVLLARRMAFGVEVVNDPDELFAAGRHGTWLSPLIRIAMTRNTRRLCRSAVSVSYVSRTVLPVKYPASRSAFVTSYSSVELADDAFVGNGSLERYFRRNPELVTVASLDQPLKGVDILIRAVAVCAAAGMPVTLTVVGDGRLRSIYERLAADLGISRVVRFPGAVPGPIRVREFLDRATLFVLASRSEGLPRVVIEAMARGLPCICTDVGAVREVLAAAWLVPPQDSGALGRRIVAALSSQRELARAAATNLLRARTFRASELQARRIEFCKALAESSRQG